MDKIVVKNSRGMKLWAKFALVTLCTLLVSAFTYESALALNIPILHNSSTNGTKYGTWGLDKGCSWCHSSNTVNVKSIAEVIETPNGPRNVIFTRMTTTLTDLNGVNGAFGNDARTYGGNGAGGSANICEVCHRQTTFHTYSVPAQTGHFDNQDCIRCHNHGKGFKPDTHEVPYYATAGVGHSTTCSTATGCHANVNPAAPYPTAGSAPDCRSCHIKDDPTSVTNCASCHGDGTASGRPTGAVAPDRAGSHAEHTAISGVTCATCHNPGGTGGNADHGMGNRGANAALVNQTSSFGWNNGDSTCSTAFCHSNPYAASTITTPPWGTDANCGACHKGTPGDFQGNGAPGTGSHNAHMTIPEIACNTCHVGASSGVYGGDHHDNGFINVTSGYPVTAKHTAGTYTGTCSTASCHANVYGPGTSTTPAWGTASHCGACHVGTPGSFQGYGSPATGSHAKHLEAPVSATCGQCHDGAVSGSDGGSSHRNASVDVTNDYTGSPVTKHAPGAYTGACQNAACHASPYAATTIISPLWGAEVGCASCHTAEGAFQNSTGHPRTGSHSKHMALNAAACNQCHAGAVKGANPGTRHLNTFVNVTGGYSTPSVTKHPVGTYSGTCANSCHTNGNGTDLASPRWGVAMPANCSGCHGGASNVTPVTAILATGKHRSHMNNISTLGKGNNLKCAECHAKTVSLASNTLVTNNLTHVNLLKDYSGVKAGGSDKYSVATKICSNVYCHSSGQALPVYTNMTGSKTWAGDAKFDCNGCHGNYPGAPNYFGGPNYPNKYQGTLATANSHERHTVVAGDTDSTACAKCHVTSADATVPNKLRNYSSTHLNMSRDVAYRYTFAGYSEVYSATEKTCATYCHSNVQTPGVVGGPATFYSKPAWGDNGTMACSSCHRDLSTLAENPTDLNFGSHRRHVAFTNLTSGNAGAGYACSLCHGAAYSATVADTPTHANGAINVPFTGKGSGTTYSQGAASAPGNGYGTCSTSKCHGRAVKNWGISTTVHVCEKCHGSANTAVNLGQFKDTGGSPTGNYAGTHVSHLAGTHNLMAPIQCSECHVVPANLDSFDHMSSMPAKLTWGPLSTRNSVIRGYTSAVAIPMVPQYIYGQAGSSGTCNNTYCHSGVKYKNISSAAITSQGKKPSPKWGDPGYLGGTGCDTCHGYPPSGTHPQSNSCSACHDHVSQSNLSMEDKTLHLNGVVNTTVDECLGCHSSTGCSPADEAAGKCFNRKLIGAHNTHTDVELFLAGKKLSTNDYIDAAWIYSIKYRKGFPQFACGFCHPMDVGLHKNGLIELDLNPNNALRGSVKTKNKDGGPWVIDRHEQTVVCNNVYCHSSGYVSDNTNQYQFQKTPDWYFSDKNGGVSAFDSVDNCAQCHGNSPNTQAITFENRTSTKEGSSAHARHVVGNHYKDVFDGYSGKLAYAGAPGSGAVHGDPSTSTNFNCNLCHYNTVRDAFNDLGSTCNGCHKPSGGTIPGGLKGLLRVYSSVDNKNHVNGNVDIAFIQPFAIKSKAQLRDNLSSVQSVDTNWTRIKGYKTYSSTDISRSTPNYVGGTCSTTSCHNGTLMEWRTKGPLACAACHVGLPQ